MLVNTQLRYYLHIADPDGLTDEEWAAYAETLNWIRKQEAGK